MLDAILKVMRTTLDIDDDVLAVTKDLASDRNLSTGKLISNLLRQALESKEAPVTRNGILLLRRPAGSLPTTMAEVNRLRDDE
jgi:hypothetical protein